MSTNYRDYVESLVYRKTAAFNLLFACRFIRVDKC